jgi:hypothetical protein
VYQQRRSEDDGCDAAQHGLIHARQRYDCQNDGRNAANRIDYSAVCCGFLELVSELVMVDMENLLCEVRRCRSISSRTKARAAVCDALAGVHDAVRPLSAARSLQWLTTFDGG